MEHKLSQVTLLECDELPFEGVRFSWLRGLPKLDLHRHLVGAIRPEVLCHIAQDLGITIPSFNNNIEQIRKCSVLNKPLEGGYKAFLDKKMWGCFKHIFRHPKGVSDAIFWAIHDANRDNIIYVEFRVSPYGLDLDFPISLSEFIRELRVGITKAYEHFPTTTAKIILSVGRETIVKRWLPDSPNKYYDRLVKIASRFRDVVVGFDISGNEDRHPNHIFKEFADRIKSAGFKLTVHAGETDNASSIQEAIELLGASRIGHGVGARRDPALRKILLSMNIPLELCPTSNWILGIVPTLRDHPFGELFREGICTTVNTDDPVIFGNTSLSMEYYRLLSHKQIALSDLETLLTYSVNASFASEQEKQTLLAHVHQFFVADSSLSAAA